MKNSLIGQKFGRLFVLDEKMGWNGKKKERMCYVWCSCNQNKIFWTKAHLFKYGGAKSCGCLRKEQVSQRRSQNLINKKFGKLLVVQKLGLIKRADGRNDCFWMCQCDCGNITKVDTHHLNNSHTRSCGCLQKEFMRSTAIDLSNKRFGRSQ